MTDACIQIDSRQAPRIRWPENRSSALSELVEEKLSARQIAAILGVTRNAVIGRCYRAGLQLQGRPTGNPGVRKRPPVQRQIPVVERPDSLNITFADLSTGQCKYAVTESPPHLFCGHQTAGGSSYCAYHYRLCYRPEDRR